MYSLFFLYLSEQIYKIMKIKLLLISFLLAANELGAAAQVSKTYYVSKPGTLISMMTEEEANSVTHLTLTGKLNAEDFRHLRDEFDNLKVLDISNAEIKMYSGKAGTYPNGKFYIYMPNFIPAYAFSNVVDGVTKGKATLEKVILSEKTKNIEDARTSKSARSARRQLPTCCRKRWQTVLLLSSSPWAAATLTATRTDGKTLRLSRGNR